MWALGDCSPVASAASALVQAVKVGGITGFVADLTLRVWAASDHDLLLQASTHPVARPQVIT
jgi:hypothetical protein